MLLPKLRQKRNYKYQKKIIKMSEKVKIKELVLKKSHSMVRHIYPGLGIGSFAYSLIAHLLI